MICLYYVYFQVSNTAGLKYNIPLMNAIVLHVGTQAIQQIQKKGHTPNMSAIAHSSHMDIFQNLAVDLDTEGEHFLIDVKLYYPVFVSDILPTHYGLFCKFYVHLCHIFYITSSWTD